MWCQHKCKPREKTYCYCVWHPPPFPVMWMYYLFRNILFKFISRQKKKYWKHLQLFELFQICFPTVCVLYEYKYIFTLQTVHVRKVDGTMTMTRQSDIDDMRENNFIVIVLSPYSIFVSSCYRSISTSFYRTIGIAPSSSRDLSSHCRIDIVLFRNCHRFIASSTLNSSN